MRSLKFELGTIMKDADYWYDAVKTRLRKRKPAAETDDRARKRRRSGRLEMVEVANQDVMPDEDYMDFLSCIGSNAEEENVEEDDEEEEEEEEEDDNDDDPDYRIFLKNLRANEGAYIFEMKKKGRKIRINYEEEDEYPENVRMDECPANVRIEKEEEEEEEEEEVDEDDDDDDEDDDEDEDEDDSLTPDDDIGDRGKKRRLEGNENENERRKWNKSNQKTSNQTKIRPFLEYCKPSDVAQADTSYLEFLSHLHVKGDALVFEHEEVYLRYEDEESEEDQGTRCRTNVNSPPHTTLKEVFTSEEDDNDDDDDDDDDDNDDDDDDDNDNDNDDDDSVQSLGGFDLESEYGKKLIKELRVPFKWKEYEDLLKAAKMNKEMVRDRELRTGWKTYSTGKERVSYLEHHPDLGRMVDQAIAKNDKRRALNLLRCLFYYLKHLSHDAAFVPWKDSRILGMIRSHSISKTI